MTNLFLTTTNFNIAPGITFPADSVLGLNIYPPNIQGSYLFIKNITLIRSIKQDDCRIMFSIFASNTSKEVAVCTTETFRELRNIRKDYVLYFTCPTTRCLCGCMVVSRPFITWLYTLTDVYDIDSNALMINPTYICHTQSLDDSYISVNSTKVDKIIFENMTIATDSETEAGKCILLDKVQVSPEATPTYMKTLIIETFDKIVELKGKSIGFTIAPQGEGNCRVSVTTENGKISFIDQSTGL